MRRGCLRGLILVILLCLGGGGVGCGQIQLEAPEIVKSLRILGIRSEPPEVAPGQTVKLTALVADPAGRPIRLEWYRCQRTIEDGCKNKSPGRKIGEGNGLSWKVPKDFLADGLKPLELLKGRELTLTLIAKAGQDSIVGIKRVVVSFVPTNLNPTLKEVTMSREKSSSVVPEPWVVERGKVAVFRPIMSGSPRQKYPALTQDGKIQYIDEPLFFSWYMTDGAVNRGRTSNHNAPAKNWKAPDKKTTVRMFVIVRDGRGGTDWKEWKVQVP